MTNDKHYEFLQDDATSLNRSSFLNTSSNRGVPTITVSPVIPGLHERECIVQIKFNSRVAAVLDFNIAGGTVAFPNGGRPVPMARYLQYGRSNEWSSIRQFSVNGETYIWRFYRRSPGRPSIFQCMHEEDVIAQFECDLDPHEFPIKGSNLTGRLRIEDTCWDITQELLATLLMMRYNLRYGPNS